MSKKPAPSLTPYLTVRGAASAIEFYTAAFDAKEVVRSNIAGTDLIQHAELKIGRASIYLCDEFVEAGILSPLSLGGSATMLHFQVDDADALWDAAVNAGALEISPLVEVPWGNHYGKLVDPFGHYWSISGNSVRTADHVGDEPAMTDEGL